MNDPPFGNPLVVDTYVRRPQSEGTAAVMLQVELSIVIQTSKIVFLQEYTAIHIVGVNGIMTVGCLVVAIGRNAYLQVIGPILTF